MFNNNLYTNLKEKLDRNDEGLCKICYTEEANQIVIPCGHLAYCEGCVKNLNNCAICRVLIK